MVGDQQLGEHAAQRHPHDVRALHTERVEHGHGVLGQCGERVGPLVEGPGGPAGVPVVVTDHAMPGAEQLHQLVGPAEPGRLRAHEQQQGGGVGSAVLLGPEAYAGGDFDEAFHGGPRCPGGSVNKTRRSVSL